MTANPVLQIYPPIDVEIDPENPTSQPLTDQVSDPHPEHPIAYPPQEIETRPLFDLDSDEGDEDLSIEDPVDPEYPVSPEIPEHFCF